MFAHDYAADVHAGFGAWYLDVCLLGLTRRVCLFVVLVYKTCLTRLEAYVGLFSMH